MLDAWLAGEVPHDVMADWCEEHGTVFPRAPFQSVRARLAPTADFWTINSWSRYDGWRTSESVSRTGSTAATYSRSREQAGGVSSSRSGPYFGQSVSGSSSMADE